MKKASCETAIEAVKDLAHTASEAAKHAMEPEPLKPGDKVVAVPMAADGMMGESMTPPFMVIRRKKIPKKTVKNNEESRKNQGKEIRKKERCKEMEIINQSRKEKAGKKAVKKKKVKKSR